MERFVLAFLILGGGGPPNYSDARIENKNDNSNWNKSHDGTEYIRK